MVAGILRSPVDTGVTLGPSLCREFRVDLRVNRAPRWLAVGVRVPPSLEGGCGAEESVYLCLETLPECGSPAGCHPPSVCTSHLRGQRRSRTTVFGNGSHAEWLEGPHVQPEQDPLPPSGEERGEGSARCAAGPAGGWNAADALGLPGELISPSRLSGRLPPRLADKLGESSGLSKRTGPGVRGGPGGEAVPNGGW